MVTKEEKKKKKKELTGAQKESLAKFGSIDPEAAIRAREKLASQRGISSKAAGDILRAGGRGEALAGQRTVAEIQAEKQQVTGQLQQIGAFEEVAPQQVPLQPERRLGESIPAFGPGQAALQTVLTLAADRGQLPFLKKGRGEIAEEAFPIQTNETIREEALGEIRRKSFKKGISIAEEFGAFVESIPVVGGAINKYARGLIETPSVNAARALEEINIIKEAASTGQEKVRNGLEDPEFGLTTAREFEERVSELEGRIKLLIISSGVLRANADQVNKIQQEIFVAKQKISRYRIASEFGLTAELTGTGRPVPTDEQIFLELKGG